METGGHIIGVQVSSRCDRIYYGWVVVLVCVIILAPISIVLDGFSLLYVSVLEEFKWNRADTATAMTIHMVLSGLASPFAGGLMDRYGPRIIMPLGAALTAIGFVWMSQCSAIWHFYVAFGVLAAVGSSMLYFTPLTSLVSKWFERHRGTAIGLVGVGQSIGQVLLPVLQFTIDRVGWRWAYFALGLIILLMPTTLALLLLHSRPEDIGLSVKDERLPWPWREKSASDVVQKKSAIGGIWSQTRRREVVVLDQTWASTEWTVATAVKTSRFWLMMSVLASYAMGLFLTSVQLVAYLVDHGYGTVMAASVMSVQGLINMLGRVWGGILSDRIGREVTLTLAVTAYLVSLVLLSLCSLFVNPVLVYSYAVAFGLAGGMCLPSLMASVADLFEGKHFGSILGIIMLGGWTVGGVGGWLSGLFFDITQGYKLSFVMAALAMVTSVWLIWRTAPRQIRVVKTVEVG
ncbi:MAG: MFS transporter [Acidobacteriota bacterium]|nr:MFS transporter [Acidobacteriota bacterium]